MATKSQGSDEATPDSKPYRKRKKIKTVSGSGLGLWIARGLAHKMHGDLTYRRHRGQALFELIFPSGDPEHEASSLTATTSV